MENIIIKMAPSIPKLLRRAAMGDMTAIAILAALGIGTLVSTLKESSD